jgi:threonine synthase
MIGYVDTRGHIDRPRSFSEAILEGIAPGGGLFVPQTLPTFDLADIAGLATLPYHERAARVYEAFGLDMGAARIRAIAAAAYGSNFDDEAVAPVRPVGDRFVLELWHGPTLAFKDMALQCMPLFFSEALEIAHASGRTKLDYLVLVATSGDTGVAALNGYADRPHTRIVVYYPDAGVSAVQERQMITQPGGNLSVFRLDGDFDACQSAVKATFDDPQLAKLLAERHGLALSSANSINWGRLLPQVVYYISAYADMVAGGHLSVGDPLDICVPTGNFGNILAAYYAKRCGAPIGHLFCASNANKVLAEFIASGDYDISDRALVKTPSPSMDILVSSNLERLLYDLSAEPGASPDTAVVFQWMAELKSGRRFSVDAGTGERLRQLLTGAWVDNEACLRTIGEVHTQHGYLLDPHTAVAWKVAGDLAGNAPVLVVSTAHWSKFAADVLRALTGVPADQPLPAAAVGAGDELELLDRVVELAPGATVPPQLRAVRERPVRFTERVAGTKAALQESLLRWLSSAAP